MAAGAVLPLPVADLIVLIAVGTIVAMIVVGVLWWRGSIANGPDVAVAPDQAGLIAVIFVTGMGRERWLAAAVLRLAIEGVLRIVDEGGVTSPGDDSPGGRRIWVERRADGPDLDRASEVDADDAGVARALFGGAAPHAALRVPARLRSDMMPELRTTWAVGTASARRRFMDVIPRRWRIAFVLGNTIAVVGGFAIAGYGLQTGEGYVLAGIAIVTGLVGFMVWIMIRLRMGALDPAGIDLRERSQPERLLSPTFGTLSEGARLLPWAVLFDRADVIARFAELVQQTKAVPDWYRCDHPFSAERLESCIAALRLGFARATPPAVTASDEEALAEFQAYRLTTMGERGLWAGVGDGGDGAIGDWGDGGAFGGGFDGGGFDGGGGGGGDGGS